MRIRRLTSLTLLLCVLFSTTSFAQSITLDDTNVDLCKTGGALVAKFSYSAIDGNKYSVSWSSAAIDSGFTAHQPAANTNAPNDLDVNVPDATAGTYNGFLKIHKGNDSDSVAITVTLKETPVLTVTPTQSTICSGQAPAISLSHSLSPNLASHFTWVNVAHAQITGPGTLTTGNDTQIDEVLNNTSDKFHRTKTYHVKATVNGCESDTVHAHVLVKFKPVLVISNGTQAICDNSAPVNLNLSLTTAAVGPPGVTDFVWRAVPDAQIGGASNSSGTSINQTLTNSDDAASHNVKYRVAAVVDDCPSDTSDADITVKPTPTLSISVASERACNGTAPDSINLSHSVGVNAASHFSWTIVKDGQIGGAGSTTTGNSTSINQVLTNSSDEDPHNITYTVRAIVASCSSSTKNVSVVVDPTPKIKPGDVDLCSGESTSITASTPSTLNWTISSIIPSIITVANPSNTGQQITEQLTNTTDNTNAIVKYSINSITSNYGCIGNNGTVDITVKPSPSIELKNTSIDTICSGDLLKLELDPSITGTYSWTASLVSGDATGFSNSGNPDPQTSVPIQQAIINNDSSAPAFVKYVITPKSNGQCTGGVLSVTAQINPKPVLVNATDDICSGTAPNITLSASTASTFAWRTIYNSDTISGPGTVTTGGAKIDSVLNSQSSTSDRSIIYRVEPKSLVVGILNGGCAGDSVDIPVVVHPLPNVSNQVTTKDICSGEDPDITLTATTPGISTFSWPTPTATLPQISGMLNSSNATKIDQTLLNTNNAISGKVTYVVTAKSNEGCTGTNTKDFEITVKPRPALDTTSKFAEICSHSTLNHQLKAVGLGIPTFKYSPATSNNYSVDRRDSTNSLIQDSITNNGSVNSTIVSYNVELDLAGCKSSETVLVTVHPKPVLNILSHKNTICSDDSTDISLRASTGGGTTIKWGQPLLDSILGATSGGNIGDPVRIPNKLTNLSHTNAHSVTYRVTTESTNLCKGDTTDIKVDVNPSPQLAITDTTICSETKLVFTPRATTPSAITQFKYKIDATAPATAAPDQSNQAPGIINHDISTNGALKVHAIRFEYTITSQGCESDQDFTVTINPQPNPPGITDPGISSLCQNTNLIHMSAARGQQQVDQVREVFHWVADNGAKINENGDPYNRTSCLVSFPNAGFTNVTLFSYVTEFPQCANTGTERKILVNASTSPNPDVVLFNGNTLVCLANNVTQGSPTAVSYQWGYTEKNTLNDVILPGRTRQDIVLTSSELDALSTRHYWVMVNFTDGCRRKAYYQGPGVAIKETTSFTDAYLKVYPNPANNYVNIEIEGVSGKNYDIELYDLGGRILKKEQFTDKNIQLNIEELAHGYYMIMCKLDGQKIAVTKFIKN